MARILEFFKLMAMGRYRVLEHSNLVSDWGIDERSALAHFLSERKVAASDPLFLKNSTERGLYFIEQGVLRAQFEHLQLDLREGDSFGELSLISENAKVVSISGISNCELWILSYESWQELKKEVPSIGVKLMEAILLKISKLLSKAQPPPRTQVSGFGSTGSQPRPKEL